jgi:hypothetical protein
MKHRVQVADDDHGLPAHGRGPRRLQALLDLVLPGPAGGRRCRIYVHDNGVQRVSGGAGAPNLFVGPV